MPTQDKTHKTITKVRILTLKEQCALRKSERKVKAVRKKRRGKHDSHIEPWLFHLFEQKIILKEEIKRDKELKRRARRAKQAKKVITKPLDNDNWRTAQRIAKLVANQ